MPRLTPRRGAALAELIVALVLSSVVSALAAMALVAGERHSRRTSAARQAESAVREAAALLSSELRAAWSDSIALRGDTAIDLLAHVGTSVACVSAGATLVLPPAAGDAVPFSWWRATPERGDRVAAFDGATPGAWMWSTVDAVSSRADGAGCSPASGLMTTGDSAARRPAVVLTLDRAITVPVGAPIRVLRRVRWLLHRGTDRSWSLAYRRCDPACGSAQPVTGPLAAAADSGLVFGRPAPGVVTATFRAPVQGGAPSTVRLRITQRDRAAPE